MIWAENNLNYLEIKVVKRSKNNLEHVSKEGLRDLHEPLVTEARVACM